MKKQITEIEREIIEKSNRSTSTMVTSTTTPAVPTSSTSQPTYKPGSVVPAVTVSLPSQHNAATDKQIVVEPRTEDIDLESLDPLGDFCIIFI